MSQASDSATRMFERLLVHLSVLKPVFSARPVMGADRLVAAIMNAVAKAGRVILLTTLVSQMCTK
jgi:hypothetical protein